MLTAQVVYPPLTCVVGLRVAFFVVQAEADSMDLGDFVEAEQVQASLQVGASARQVIMEGVLQLQVPFDTSIACTFACAGNIMGSQYCSRQDHFMCSISTRCSCASCHADDSCTAKVCSPRQKSRICGHIGSTRGAS